MFAIYNVMFIFLCVCFVDGRAMVTTFQMKVFAKFDLLPFVTIIKF